MKNVRNRVAHGDSVLKELGNAIEYKAFMVFIKYINNGLLEEILKSDD
jgi:uncharacterized membrane protein YecN with MAPEG domain